MFYAQERMGLDARQSSMKILINSFYGYLAYNRALFNDFRAADAVTGGGQEILRQIMQTLRGLMAGFQSPYVPGLPRFTGGAVGYLGYDAVPWFAMELADAGPLVGGGVAPT